MPYSPSTQVHTGIDGAAVLGDRPDHASRRCRGRVVRGAGLEQADDLAAAVPGAIDQRVDLFGAEQVGQRLAVDRAGRRDRHHRVAVRSERQRLHDAGRHAEPLGHEVGEPGRVEHPGLADHPVRGELGDLRGQRGHLIQRVRHHDQHGVGRVLDHLLGDAAHDLGVDARSGPSGSCPAYAAARR